MASTTFAPRIPFELLEAIVQLDDRSVSIAEVNRRVGREAHRLGYAKPSYQRVRELVQQSRLIRRGPTTASVLVDVALRARPPEALVGHLSGVGLPPYDEAAGLEL
jgi:hypothetical protein